MVIEINVLGRRLNMCRIRSSILFAFTVVATLAATGVEAFTSAPTISCRGEKYGSMRLQSMSMDDSPSDSSDSFFDDNNEVVTVESEVFSPTESEVLVTNVLDLIPTNVGGAPSDEETRAEINEVLLKLETLNPTSEPATSPLLNGIWELRYAGLYTSKGSLLSPTRQLALFLYSGGYSPGLFALQLAKQLPSNIVDIVGSLDITISREAPRVEGLVTVNTLLGGESSVEVKSNLEVLSDIRLRETYESATVLGGQVVDLPKFLQYTRDIYVTYLDEELLVIRDGSGVPELLIRKEKSFTQNWGDSNKD